MRATNISDLLLICGTIQHISFINNDKTQDISSLPKRKGPTQAQFIRVINDTPKGFLHLAEIEIFHNDKNIARESKASQSSNYPNGPAKNAIDGNTSGDFSQNSVTHTQEEAKPWLEIDLGSEKTIDRIQFFNRTDNGVGNRLKNFWVVAYDAKKQPVWVKRGEKTPTPKWKSNLPLSFERFTKEDNASVISFLSQDNSRENEKLQKRIKGIEKQLQDYKGDQVPKDAYVELSDRCTKKPTKSLFYLFCHFDTLWPRKLLLSWSV